MLAHGNNGSLWWGSNSHLTGIQWVGIRRANHCVEVPNRKDLTFTSMWQRLQSHAVNPTIVNEPLYEYTMFTMLNCAAVLN